MWPENEQKSELGFQGLPTMVDIELVPVGQFCALQP
jgi:hypothetical protein